MEKWNKIFNRVCFYACLYFKFCMIFLVTRASVPLYVSGSWTLFIRISDSEYHIPVIPSLVPLLVLCWLLLNFIPSSSRLLNFCRHFSPFGILTFSLVFGIQTLTSNLASNFGNCWFLKAFLVTFKTILPASCSLPKYRWRQSG